MNLKNALQNIRVSADYISLRLVNSRSIYLRVRNEKFEGLHKENEKGVMVEVLKDGQFGYAATADLS